MDNIFEAILELIFCGLSDAAENKRAPTPLIAIHTIKETPHNYRPSGFVGVCLQIFRHLAQSLLDGRKPVCVDFVQSAEKFDGATARQ